MKNPQGGLTITVPKGAVCGVYPGVPGSFNYHNAIDPANAIAPTYITHTGGIDRYDYTDLDTGLYHCGVSLDGHYAICQMIHYTAEKAKSGFQLDLRPEALAGGGYEADYVMLNTTEFMEKQLCSHKDAWGVEYAGLFRTPQFRRQTGMPGRHQQTTNEEVADFIAQLAATNQRMHVFSLGKSPKYGYDLPLVLFTRENVAGLTLQQAADVIRRNGKPTVQYAAQCHSTEPASTEGALAMMLQLCGEYGDRTLDAVDIYIIPRINPDGAYEVRRQSPTTGDDMNRDYLYARNREIQAVIEAYNLFLPEVVIDGHEKQHSIRVAEDGLCTDMELQVGAGSLNHPAVMTELAMKMALQALEKAKSLGLRSHFYAKLASAAGGCAGSSYFGTRNSLSFLVETPGQVYLGGYFMERRVLGQYILASTVIDYTASNPAEILATVHGSRKKMAKDGQVYDETDLMILEHDKEETGQWATPLIHVPSGHVTDPDHAAPYNEHTKYLCARVRPTAYLLPQGLPREKEILRVLNTHAIGYYTLPAGSRVMLRQYMQGAEEITLGEETSVLFEQGAYVLPNALPSTILSVIMEPDFNKVSGRKMTLLSMGLIEAAESGCLPVYRYCHDLTEGKVTANI